MPRSRRSGGPHALELRHLSALREAMMDRGFGGGAGGRLPLHLLLSDRDFDENDYEALLALDEGVESRKGGWQACAGQGRARRGFIAQHQCPHLKGLGSFEVAVRCLSDRLPVSMPAPCCSKCGRR